MSYLSELLITAAHSKRLMQTITNSGDTVGICCRNMLEQLVEVFKLETCLVIKDASPNCTHRELLESSWRERS